MPEIEVSTYYTSLLEEEPEVIEALYAEHGTIEQFHSELKSDMDLERLPSGKFETNDLQNLITIASRVFFHANRFKLGLSRDEPWFRSFRRIYQAFAFGN
ncbi:Transposase DDE domain-containing protein [Caldanaerovirga acetigignens]|uniref:Transposase DDE domain-containing protein n=1 Tax=Caldanaerovirga acetigignens TaxID=447595 RepID=A0A1M7M057_9FIRM|nr:Transposase DDE domain-containing protein [Caldanaerovirga acetigignens]